MKEEFTYTETHTIVTSPEFDHGSISLEEVEALVKQARDDINKRLDDEIVYAMTGVKPPIEGECYEVEPKKLLQSNK
jgi:uncharacterized protein YeeX (DUF496 family)